MNTPVKSPMVELNDFASKSAADDDDSKDISETWTDSSSGAGSADCEDDVFSDALTVQFHSGTFVYQLAAHLFLPLYIFMVNSYGQISTEINNILGSFLCPLCVYVMLVSYQMTPIENREPSMEGAYIIPLIYFLQHRLVIAIKYASMSRTEYFKFMTCLDRVLCCKYLAQVQLFQAWYDFNPLVIRFELSAASAKIGARINEIDLFIQNPDNSASALNQLRAWNAFLRGHDVIDYTSKPCKQLRPQKDGGYALSVYDFCEALLLHSTKMRAQTDTYCVRITTFFNWLNLSIPFIFLTYYSPKEDLGASAEAYMFFFYLSSTILNLCYAQLFYFLLYISVVDVIRQKSVFSNLNNMIRISDIMLQAELSSCTNKVTAKDLQETELRVAEVMSIRSCCYRAKGKYVHMKFESESMRDTVSTVGSAPQPAMSAWSSGTHMHDPRMHSVDTTTSSFSTPDHCANSPHASGGEKARSSVLGERIYKDNEYHMLPRIDFNSSHNIVAWTHARLVMQNFGERFKFRLELYVICAMAMLLVMMVVALFTLGMSQNRMRTFLTPWFMQVLLSVTMCVGFLIIIMQCGASVNSILQSHSQTLCSHALRLNRKVEKVQFQLQHETDPKKIDTLTEKVEHLKEIIEKLDSMTEIIDTNTEMRPFKVFGFEAQSSLTMSITTTAVSFYGVIITLLTNSSDTVYSALDR